MIVIVELGIVCWYLATDTCCIRSFIVIICRNTASFMQLCIYMYVYIDVYVDIYFHIALDLSEPALKPYNILEQVSI